MRNQGKRGGGGSGRSDPNAQDGRTGGWEESLFGLVAAPRHAPLRGKMPLGQK